ncbi:hypothetical protein AAE02nite_38020 [Adhaeribacter aerolatus]|uniref:Uncharacterized protein n=1 Tax=Adhaeribacter aerolatus TaxID=670289 RepID=A0A512B2E9_9BACT|nr:SIR2 family protein [Adhaeribacter aerolatus]GEO06138.1 hypothetical protein AAE02nite_38020 [Adhaeribacter aerolatus]
MHKENLFKLIRSEEVVLWAGAGLSLYAGFPSGEKLGTILYNSLSDSEKKEIRPDLLLPDLAEAIYRIKGNNKNSIIRILSKQFVDFIPESTLYHDKLASIPHFKTIITTNYDKLIENAYGQRGQLLLASRHIPYIEKEKVSIFKVHGDLSEPDSIILTKTDFNNFFKNSSESEVYWTVIKEKLATKNVLFIGYNLEDPNVSVIFDRISEVLGTHRRECFFISPNLTFNKILELDRKGIHYIDSTGEAFIDELDLDIKQNITKDLEKGMTSANTFRDFLYNNKLIAEVKSNKDSFKLVSLNGIDGKIEGKLNFSLKNDEEFNAKLNDFIKGYKFGDFEIPEGRLLKSDFTVNGIKLPGSDEVAWLKFQSVPSITSIIDIRFDDGSEFNEIPVKIYRSPFLIEIHVQLKSAFLKINFEPVAQGRNKTNFHYEHEENCLRVKDEIELFLLLNNFASGKQFKIYTQTGIPYTPTTLKKLPPLLKVTQYYLAYFSNLKILEQHYDVRFSNINIKSINKEAYEFVMLAVAVTKGETLIVNFNKEFQVELNDVSDRIISQLKKVNKDGVPFVALFQEEVLEIHGQKINLGFKRVEYLKPKILNLDSVLKGAEQKLKFKSKRARVKYSYNEDFKEGL